MAKMKTFRVVNGRVHFKCYACQGRRMVAIPPGTRRRSIRCNKCGEITRCDFNRRTIQREQQRGKILMSTNDGDYVEVDLYDLSINGIGFDVSIRDVRKMTVGKEIQFRCTWNPRLLGQGRYIIRSTKGRRIGAQRY
jgi:hypothetical protein